MYALLGILAWLLRWVEGFLYGPLWLSASDWFGERAETLERLAEALKEKEAAR